MTCWNFVTFFKLGHLHQQSGESVLKLPYVITAGQEARENVRQHAEETPNKLRARGAIQECSNPAHPPASHLSSCWCREWEGSTVTRNKKSEGIKHFSGVVNANALVSSCRTGMRVLWVPPHTMQSPLTHWWLLHRWVISRVVVRSSAQCGTYPSYCAFNWTLCSFSLCCLQSHTTHNKKIGTLNWCIPQNCSQ